MSIASLEGISRVYQMGEHEVWALRELDLEITQGDFVVILGPSGSGKTTLLNILGGIDLPTSGHATIDGVELAAKPDLSRFRREKIGHVFQFFNLIPTLTAQENVEYVLELQKGLSRKQIHRRARKYLDSVGLLERANHFPVQCSGGEQQRIAIARALAKEPTFILADEPTGELDFETGRLILDLLQKINEEKNITVIVVTHNAEVGKISDVTIRLRRGEIAEIIDNRNSKILASELIW
ncbi:MAG: ABC transporter ATP-binding protein [Candidatus Hodarchaeales archaeon]|jgi:putative ABC transport system ATP-binding protein